MCSVVMGKTVVAMAGLPASGKSAVALKLHDATDSVLLNKDNVRDFMFDRYVDYSTEQNDLCIEMMYQVALYLLSRKDSPLVIIDGRSFSRRTQIDRLHAFVSEAQCTLRIIECVCSKESARERLHKDKGIHPAKDRNFAMYSKSRASADTIVEPRLTLDTDALSEDECGRRAIAYIVGAT